MPAPTVEETYTAYGNISRLFTCKEPEIMLAGPAGCIAGETRIYNPVTGEHVPVKELYEKGIAPIVQTLMGAIQAEVPFRKGVADLYRLTLASGRKCIVTQNHLLLSDNNWIYLSACVPGTQLLISSPCPDPTTGVPGPLVSQQDALRLSQTPLNCQDDYLQDHCQCDVLPQWEAGNALTPVPSQFDALSHSRVDLLTDDRVGRQGYTHACLPAFRPSMQDCWNRPEQKGFSPFASSQGNFLPCGDRNRYDAQSLRETDPLLPIAVFPQRAQQISYYAHCTAGYRVTLEDAALVGAMPQPHQPLHGCFSYAHTLQELPVSALALDAYNLSMLTSDTIIPSDKLYYTAQWDAVSSIEYVRTDEYFDLHVPIAEHYLAEGIWHHNTGKSRGNLEYLNYWASEYSRCRILMLRKTRRSLTESGMVTFEQKVLNPAQGVRFHSSMQQYQYPNGSIIAVGGLDKPSKIMSSEWDIIFAQEATELTDEDWEMCGLRVRNGKLPVQQIIGDCNPGPSTHWLKQRAQAGGLLMMETVHEDNPVLFTRTGEMTPEGARYIGKLDKLTGVRYARYRLGLWVSAEGMVYEQEWNPAVNIVNSFPIPKEWPRYLAVDFGYVHAFVCLWAALDPDGRIYIYRQIYKTRTLVEDHAKVIKQVSRWGQDGGDPLPREIICDHDAEDRATLERHLGLHTMPAHKSVSDGIQATASRFRVQGDGKPRVMIMRDSLVERDHDLAEGKLPTCVQEEPESYIWDTRQGMKKGEAPVKENDHGLDALRYLVARWDLRPTDVRYSNRIY